MATTQTPPSLAAPTLSGTIIARAPKVQSIMRKPVTPRMAQAPGITTDVTVPGGVVTSIGRNMPSLLGMSAGRMERTAV